MFRKRDVDVIDMYLVGWHSCTVELNPVNIPTYREGLGGITILTGVFREFTNLGGIIAIIGRSQNFGINLFSKADPVHPLVPPLNIECTGRRRKNTSGRIVTLGIHRMRGIVIERIPNAVVVGLRRECAAYQ